MTVHPSFTARAAEWMRSAGGDPAAAGDLALTEVARALTGDPGAEVLPR